ncbi:holo-ACP synthase [Nostoc sp. UIC 10630]|uniref:holo-ACP synthase n=1 Tax=Nostoc sp. UIC 10630 TaxID=2100146 RepID=UPI0013D45918|nr:holo-ACP synthase [Nostoc sp. UIC 10630]NEU82064.1 holo-ACP synthase [Nostoc sp. UIC 10630]
MAGSGGMLIGLGHDIQLIAELTKVEALKLPGIFFTNTECLYFSQSKNPLQSMAGTFSAKEALFKALAMTPNFYWTDVEVRHNSRYAPYFEFYGSLAEHFQVQGWTVHLSISHSGDYVSTVVAISPQS